MKTECPHCHTRFNIADEHKGKTIQCKNCQKLFEISEYFEMQELKSTEVDGKSQNKYSIKPFLGGLICIILVVGLWRYVTSENVSPNTLTFGEFKTAVESLGNNTGDIITQEMLFSRLGQPENTEVIDSTREVYIYYKVRDGNAQIVADLDDWLSERVRTYYASDNRPEPSPPNDDALVEWAQKHGYKSPYTIKLKMENESLKTYLGKYEVYKDGKFCEEFWFHGLPKGSFENISKSCKIVHHVKERDGGIPEDQIPIEYVSDIEHYQESYLIMDGSGTKIIRAIGISSGEEYQMPENRATALKSAKEIVANIMNRWDENVSTVKKQQKESQTKAEDFVKERIVKESRIIWDTYIEKQQEEKALKLKGPFLRIKAINKPF
jgi:predicted Zn finger-like uncharacterized protein